MAFFQKGPTGSAASFLQKDYEEGGKGINIAGQDYALWFSNLDAQAEQSPDPAGALRITGKRYRPARGGPLIIDSFFRNYRRTDKEGA